MAKTAVAKKEDTSIVTKIDRRADAGAGSEEANVDAFAIPFITILQQLSPQVQEGEVEGAKPGMFFNTVTGEVAKELTVVPCYFRRTFVEWIPRDAGGGFVAEHSQEEGLKLVENLSRDGAAWVTKDGHEIADTRMHYVLVLQDDGSYEPAVISLTSTGIKVSRNWMTAMQNWRVADENGTLYNPAMFARSYKLTSTLVKGQKGTYYSWQIKPNSETTDAVYLAAKDFKAQVAKGAVRAAHETTSNENEVEEDVAF